MKAGVPQGISIALVPFLVALTMASMLPVLPAIAADFAHVPGVVTLAPLVAVLPSLSLALFAVPAGVLGDRVGRRRLLVWSTAVFAVFAMLPWWLESLYLILACRAVVGVALACMMTAATGLTGDYFEGAERERWSGIQIGVPTVLAIGVLVVSGIIGESGWRTPILLNLFAVPVLAALILFTWEPRIQRREAGAVADRLPMGTIARALAVMGWGILIFTSAGFEVGFLLAERGASSPTIAGIATALFAVGGGLASFAFPLLGRWSTRARLLLVFAVGTLGTLIQALAPSSLLVIAGGVFIGAGTGILMPTITIWLLSLAPESLRGRTMGLMQTMYFLAQFLGPVAVGAAVAVSGGHAEGRWPFVVAATASLIVALGALLAPRRLREAREGAP